ncbi:MAG: BolA family protein [Burkholderiales bacterium]
MNTISLMQERLASLVPARLEISDDSAEHVGHAGAASGGGHYHVTIVSQVFAGKNPVARHRLVYQALGDLMQQRIHALAIAAYTPDQL